MLEMRDGAIGVAIPDPDEAAEAAARFGLRTTALSIRAAPASRSAARWASA
jgi:hypothetical protein